MSDAFYCQGLTIEYDLSDPHLTIDGQQIKVVHEEGGYRAPNLADSELASAKKESLLQLAELIIANWEKYRQRGEIKKKHLAILKEGVEHWNKWRRDHPGTRPLLYEADLKEEIGVDRLELPDFSNANLINADLTGMTLIEPNFHEANLGGAKLCRTILCRANFCRTDLYETDLSDARLIEANLQGTQLAKTIFKRATLKNCKIYGLSAWDLDLEAAKQENHIIRYRYEIQGKDDSKGSEAQSNVDDLEVAQLIYLMLHNEKIRGFIDTVTTKTVLILGRFTPERKAVLHALREELRKRDRTPILFDFDQPESRNLTDTVKLLAQMARYIIVDLSDPNSAPYELGVISMLGLDSTPVVPVITRGQQPFPMLVDLLRKPWSTKLVRYKDLEDIRKNFDEMLVKVAEAKVRKLRPNTARRTQREAAAPPSGTISDTRPGRGRSAR